MRPEEARAIGELAGDAAGGLTARVHDMHAGIAERVFVSLGPASAPVRAVHDRVAAGAYAAVATGTRALVRGAVALAGAVLAPGTRSLSDTTRGRLAIGALNGAFGDAMERSGSALTIPMTVRHHGRDVAATATGLAAAFPDATPRLAVFVHGLCETDDAWALGSERHRPYGPRLQAELGYTPLYVRYNSGRHISENGRELAELLACVVDGWPVPVSEMALFGHSMGGLVCRSACHYGAGGPWCAHVRHVFSLSTPHLGAPLEQGANVASVALARLPETRALARALNTRSAGIKDLRYGYLLDEDWDGQDADTFLRNTGRQIPFLESANHYFVCATLSADPHTPSGRIIGDLLVLRASAWAHGGGGERMRFPVEHYRHVGGANHLAVLNHPAVYAQIRDWLGARRALPAPA